MLPAALIGNIVTNVISGRFTTLQIALGIVLNRKKMIERMTSLYLAAVMKYFCSNHRWQQQL